MAKRKLKAVDLGAGVGATWPTPSVVWEANHGGARVKVRIGYDGSWSAHEHKAGRGYSLGRSGEAGSPEAARTAAKAELAKHGYRISLPPLGKPRKVARRSRAPELPRGGYYPDLLGPTEDIRGANCGLGEPERQPTGSRHVRHETCDDGGFHHLRYLDDGVVVAGLTLRASRPWRGRQSATIDRVYAKEAYRRQGFATALLNEAEAVFRRVQHSKDLTTLGKLWKKATGG